METEHRVLVGDARQMGMVGDDQVELVVTSPPYPMIEMWDDLFARLDPQVEAALDAGAGGRAFELMHAALDPVWDHLGRVLVDGGIACINIGDATRKVDGSFRVYQNHARVIDAFTARGFTPLPEILWRKPVNSGTKFMGSGMLPPNAYVTLEHEYLLVFRNGPTPRSFPAGSEDRYESAFFWEERNQWFSDVWFDVRGEHQALERDDLRARSAAYPFEIPYRLINMYSVYGDTVLDPFWGTGTTSLAAIAAARNSIGIELDSEFTRVFSERVQETPELSRWVVARRLAAHQEFVDGKHDAGRSLGYESEHYGFPVTTKQETRIRLYTACQVIETPDGYRVHHRPADDDAVDPGVTRTRGSLSSLTDFE